MNKSIAQGKLKTNAMTLQEEKHKKNNKQLFKNKKWLCDNLLFQRFVFQLGPYFI